jgi:protein MAK11
VSRPTSCPFRQHGIHFPISAADNTQKKNAAEKSLVYQPNFCSSTITIFELSEIMVKRKRNDTSKEEKPIETPAKTVKSAPTPSQAPDTAITIQVVTGSYERVLHGFTAGFPASTLNTKDEASNESDSSIQCVDTFLFEAHGSAIRCLALSPLPKATDSADAKKVFLASGSTDERIQLYSLAAAPPAVSDEYPSVPTLAGNKILENPKNRELGSLLHHSASITALSFPSRSKLLAAGEDNEISISKTRDWSVVSTIKAPHPKVQGRPSGDTAPPGAAPSGVNHFAVHPSMKLMLSVGKGEKCMRLWNLVTGKKAGVLNFGREILVSVKEGKWSSGEGRRLAWNAAGEEFAVAFEWGAVVFGVVSLLESISALLYLTLTSQYRTQLPSADFSPALEARFTK